MTKTLTLKLAAAALLAAGSTAAIAAHHEDGGTHTRAEAQAKAAEMFAKMDANGDGVLNAADREAHKAQRFAKVDTDGNGQLSQAELDAAREAHKGKRGDMAQGPGAGKEGRKGKHGGPGGRGGKRGDMAKAMMMRADKDGDKAISKAEFTAAALARFDAADANDDGTVTAEERKAKMGEMRGKMRDQMKERRAAQAG